MWLLNRWLDARGIPNASLRFLDKYEEKLQETQLTQQYTELAKSKRKVEDAMGATGKIEKVTVKVSSD